MTLTQFYKSTSSELRHKHVNHLLLFTHMISHLAVDYLQAQSIVGLVTDGQQNSVGSAGSELQPNGHVQTHSVVSYCKKTRGRQTRFRPTCPLETNHSHTRFNPEVLTRFHESCAFKVSSRLRGNKAPSHHVTGAGRSHVQFKVFNNGFRATLRKRSEGRTRWCSNTRIILTLTCSSTSSQLQLSTCGGWLGAHGSAHHLHVTDAAVDAVENLETKDDTRLF